MTEPPIIELASVDQIFRLGGRAAGRLFHGLCRRGPLPARRQRRRQVDADQDPVRRASAEQRRDPGRRQAGALRVARAMRSISASPRSTRTSRMVPLMSIARNFFLGREPSEGLGAVPPLRLPSRERAPRARRWPTIGIRRARPRPAGRHAVRRRTPMRGDRPRRLFRRPRADPRRADLGARRPPGGDGADA